MNSFNPYNHLSKVRLLIVKMVSEFTKLRQLPNESSEAFVKRAVDTLTDEQRNKLNQDIKDKLGTISYT